MKKERSSGKGVREYRCISPGDLSPALHPLHPGNKLSGRVKRMQNLLSGVRLESWVLVSGDRMRHRKTREEQNQQIRWVRVAATAGRIFCQEAQASTGPQNLVNHLGPRYIPVYRVHAHYIEKTESKASNNQIEGRCRHWGFGCWVQAGSIRVRKQIGSGKSRVWARAGFGFGSRLVQVELNPRVGIDLM